MRIDPSALVEIAAEKRAFASLRDRLLAIPLNRIRSGPGSS